MIKIVSCFCNVEKYIKRCISSITKQKFENYEVYLIDDMSSDQTVNVINELIGTNPKFKLIVNTEKKFKLKNMYDLISNREYFDEEDIVVELDGDDFLFNENVLNKVNDVYADNSDTWLTNGSFIYSDGRNGFSSEVNPETVRTDNFNFSHLRTWKTHLWRKIKLEDFLDDNGDFFKSAPDVAYSYPMVEMAGKKHYKFIKDILYVYNEENPYNEHKKMSQGGFGSQVKNTFYIQSKPKYESI